MKIKSLMVATVLSSLLLGGCTATNQGANSNTVKQTNSSWQN